MATAQNRTAEELREAYDRIDAFIRSTCRKINYFVCWEAPDVATKLAIVAFAKTQGLVEDKHGTLRAWAQYPDDSLLAHQCPGIGLSVYVHTQHPESKHNRYFSASDATLLFSWGKLNEHCPQGPDNHC